LRAELSADVVDAIRRAQQEAEAAMQRYRANLGLAPI
jgi:hypothetical protein